MRTWQQACRSVFEVALHSEGHEDMATSLQPSVWSGITQRGRWGHGNKPVGQYFKWHYTTREVRTWKQACRRVFELTLHNEGDEDMAISLQTSVWSGITQRGRWGHGNKPAGKCLNWHYTARKWGHGNKPAGQCLNWHYAAREMRTWQQACRSVCDVSLHNEGYEDMATSLQVSVWSGITQLGRWGHGNKPAGQCLKWHYTARDMRTWQQACNRVFEVALHSEGDEDMATSL